jgi:hypothetical protein
VLLFSNIQGTRLLWHSLTKCNEQYQRVVQKRLTCIFPCVNTHMLPHVHAAQDLTPVKVVRCHEKLEDVFRVWGEETATKTVKTAWSDKLGVHCDVTDPNLSPTLRLAKCGSNLVICHRPNRFIWLFSISSVIKVFDCNACDYLNENWNSHQSVWLNACMWQI